MDYLSKFDELKSKDLSLDLTRGKPSSDQLDLSNELANFSDNIFFSDGVDLRNYGEVQGLDSCRELGSDILLPLFLGSFICGIVLGLIGYFFILSLWRWQVIKNWEIRKNLRKKSKEL